MKLKKTLSTFMALSICSSALGISAYVSNTASAYTELEADGGFSAKKIENSPVKPKLTASQKVLKLDEIPENRIVSVSIDVSGAEQKYASTGMHIYYDSRLTVNKNSIGKIDAKYGKATEYLDSKTVSDDSTAPEGWNGIFACTSCSENIGLDGTYLTINFILPEDTQSGDVYPIDIIFKSDPIAKDLFTNKDNDENGKLMQAYTFTQGIYNEEYNCNFRASKADVEQCKALDDIAGDVDGYIAIADDTTDPPIFTADGGFTAKQIANAPVKPKLTASQKVLKLDEIPEDRIVSVDIDVSGAEKKYASTGMHVYYDSRLTIGLNQWGEPDVPFGNAAKYLTTYPAINDPTAPEGWEGIFAATASKSNIGLDGTFITLNFIVPEDAKPGDVYPIDILYKSNKINEDLFVNTDKDEAGKLMQAYTFTQGIYNEEYNCNFRASKADIALCKALDDIAGYVDGYIAIADEENTADTFYGDANCDGKVSIADATAILQHLGNEDKYGLSEQGKKNADVDGKKGVTGNDAITIQMVDAKMLTVEELPLKN